MVGTNAILFRLSNEQYIVPILSVLHSYVVDGNWLCLPSEPLLTIAGHGGQVLADGVAFIWAAGV